MVSETSRVLWGPPAGPLSLVSMSPEREQTRAGKATIPVIHVSWIGGKPGRIDCSNNVGKDRLDFAAASAGRCYHRGPVLSS